MNAIKKRRAVSAALLVSCIFITILFAAAQTVEMVIVFSFADIALFIFLYRQNKLFHDASLICNNEILCASNETVISTFGLLIGRKVYQWGCDGVKGTRLKQVKLDKERIWMIFGTEEETKCIELQHGIMDKQDVIDTAQKILYETGVTATITDW